jgi:putative two-component system protein, hydrogenase maturation factor HypX/HoxX
MKAHGDRSRATIRHMRERARRLAWHPEFRLMLRKKHERRLDGEYVKPLASYRAEELEWMRANFFGPDPVYHEARRRFVFKGNPPPQRSRVPIRAAVEAINKSLAEVS